MRMQARSKKKAGAVLLSSASFTVLLDHPRYHHDYSCYDEGDRRSKNRRIEFLAWWLRLGRPQMGKQPSDP